MRIHTPKGSALIVMIIFSTLFIMSLGAVVSLIVSQHFVTDAEIADEVAFQSAEAGLNKYRWILAHNPTDYTGLDEDYLDGSSNPVGHYTVTVDDPEDGSSIVTITSTGYSLDRPGIKRYIRAQYGKPSYVEYAFVTNSNIWFGDGEEVNGRLHSNAGIRMDGDVDSLTTTIRETYTCGPEHGCSPSEEKPGIWGSGGNQQLWDFPVADAVDFDAITFDFESMRDAAQTDGVYIDESNKFGYHLVFQNDGTFDVNEVQKLENAVWGYDGTDWQNESNTINKEKAVNGMQNVPIPSNGIVFVNDKVWISGEVNGRVTVASAELPSGQGDDREIIIADSVTYYPDRESGAALGLIAQGDILVPLYSPDDLEIDGALLSQNGHVMRYYYSPSSYPQDAIRNSIQTYGMIASNDAWTWSWTDGVSITSGYQNTLSIYDSNLLYAPPPFFPTRDEFRFISWEEILPAEL